MDLIASFSSQKLKKFNFFTIRRMFGERDIFFLFDTGASLPVVGVNSFFRKDGDDYPPEKYRFENFLKDRIASLGILPRDIPLKTATNQDVESYPCVCRDVLIDTVTIKEFFFDVAFDEVHIPLLGTSFSDDCGYSHSINGNIIISSMKSNPGSGDYSGLNVLDFNQVVKDFCPG